MKICSIRIKDFRQFEDTFIDFTNPETGEPVSKVCFIGRNGTGKSTLLGILYELLIQISSPSYDSSRKLKFNSPVSAIAVKIKLNGKSIYLFTSRYSLRDIVFEGNIESVESWFDDITLFTSEIETLLPPEQFKHFEEKLIAYKQYIILGKNKSKIFDSLKLIDNSYDLLIHSPAESPNNSYMGVQDVPRVNREDALQLIDKLSFSHWVSDSQIGDFWKILIYLIEKRSKEREIFETQEESLNKTKRELIKEFDKIHPEILDKLAILWNKILDKAGLEFDVKNAVLPDFRNKNLLAYIRLKTTKERINYNQLSTGIRNFIFRIGHIYALYFNRSIKRGFLLIDEPENSLFPDFLFDLVETYEELVIDKNGENNTQMFISTHNPIIAAQFEPYERIILEWDDHGYVKANRGEAPVGDDPNDVLRRDFNLSNLMGREGQKMWEKYLDLRKQLRRTKDESKKEELIYQINKIGTDYNFGS